MYNTDLGENHGNVNLKQLVYLVKQQVIPAIIFGEVSFVKLVKNAI